MRSLMNKGLRSVNNFTDKPRKLFIDLPAYFQWYLRESRRLIKFKDCHRGQSCFIIGNGPSLNQMDLLPLNNYVTFGLNKIYLIFEKVDLKLTYQVAVNPLVIQQSTQELKKLKCDLFVAINPSYKLIRRQNNIYKILTRKPIFNRIFGGGELFFQENISKSTCEGFTVTYVAMQIAFYMGFSTIYLIGVDHNFFAKGKPNEQQRLIGADLNHFSYNYFGDQDWNLPDLEASEAAYRLAKKYFEQAGRKIYDATVDGKLTIFPKISYEEALSACQRSQAAVSASDS
ncbi:MAG: 6-hydroxymethylpterin diphosphokinase MptE-like protein [Leptolyngbyaceae cyanobacterium]